MAEKTLLERFGSIIGASAPLVGTLLGTPAAGLAIAGIVKAVGLSDETDEATLVQHLETLPEEGVGDIFIEAEKTTQAELAAMSVINKGVGKQALAEVQSEDKFISRARPSNHYAIVYGAIVLFTLAPIAFFMDTLGEYESAMGDYSTIVQSFVPIIAALSAVAGLYVWKRSDDKVLAMTGSPRVGLLQTLVGAMKG